MSWSSFTGKEQSAKSLNSLLYALGPLLFAGSLVQVALVSYTSFFKE